MVTPSRIQPRVDAAAQHGLGGGELGAVVHPERLGRVGRRRADDEMPGGAQHPDDVGQVVLALPVLGLEAAQRGREQPPAEAVDRRVDLGDGELGLVAVGLLDDAVDRAAASRTIRP